MEIIGNKFIVDFGNAKSILHFNTETSLQFQIIEKDGKPADETETVKIN